MPEILGRSVGPSVGAGGEKKWRKGALDPCSIGESAPVNLPFLATMHCGTKPSHSHELESERSERASEQVSAAERASKASSADCGASEQVSSASERCE